MRRKRRRGRSSLLPLGELIGRTPEVAAVPSRSRLPIPLQLWQRAVGPRVAMRTRPIRLDGGPGGTLVVQVSSAVWAQELSLLESDIRARLRELGVQVSRLRLRVGPVEPLRPPGRELRAPEVPRAPLPGELRDRIARVPDDELRRAITEAARRNLGWQSIPKGKRPTRGPLPAPPASPEGSASPEPLGALEPADRSEQADLERVDRGQADPGQVDPGQADPGRR